MKTYDCQKPLISLHIPKCAGQSFRAVLEQWFGTKFFIHYFQQYNAMPPKHELKPGICIHGHFNRTRGFGVLDYYPQAEQFITVLRDPLEAAISNYFYWKAKARENQLKKGIIKTGDEHDYRNIDDFFKKRPKSNFLDFMPCELTPANYKEILETKFTWIGLVENLDESVGILARKLGFTSVPLERINASPRDEDLSSALQRDFIRANALEFEIYHYAKDTISSKGVLNAH
jgi:hypothetical protein